MYELEDTSKVTKQCDGFSVFPYTGYATFSSTFGELTESLLHKRHRQKRMQANHLRTQLYQLFSNCAKRIHSRRNYYMSTYYSCKLTRTIFPRRKQRIPVVDHEVIMKTDALGQVYTVHPNNAECFYFWKLIHKIRVQTVDGYLLPHLTEKHANA